MKWKWLVIAIGVMYTITRNDEETNNPLTLYKIIAERGMVAWIELIVLTTVIILPSFFVTKMGEQLTRKFFPQLSIWKSIVFAVSSSILCYFVIMAILEPIKHV